MMSLRRIFGLMLLFLFFEAVVAVATSVFYPDKSVPLACLVMTGLAVGTWLVFVLLARLLSKQRAPKAAAPQGAFVPVASRTSHAEDSFTLEFNALVSEANRRLQALVANDGQREAPAVFNLPLYLVLGAEGSGKTAAMVNSGLEVRLLAGEAQKDGSVMPTAIANLWFAEGAIFVEIAGRILMDAPDRFEKALQILGRPPQPSRWKKLLHGKTVYRPNLRGVLVVCDTEIFLQSRDVHRIGTVARTINERLQSIQAAMRSDFPTYVVLTKCDSVSYFQEFFSQLNETESRRILGVTLPFTPSTNEYANVYSDREGGRLTKLIGRLYQSLADKRMILLAREDVTDKRAQAYEFPREFKKIRGELVQFLLDAFRPSTLHPPCRLRGFYFSGVRYVPRANAVADTTAIDQSIVMKRPTDATGIFRSSNKSSTLDYSVVAKGSNTATTSKWTFLNELFREIILRDPAGKVAPGALRVEDSRYLTIALGAGGIVCLLLSVFWVFSWQRNHGLLTEVQAAVLATAPTTAGSSTETLGELESLRPLVIRLHGYTLTSTPTSYRWGLYQGARASEDLDSLYYTRFRQAILDPTLYAMSGGFLQLQPSAPVTDDIYKELKTYRTLTSGSCKPDESLIASVMLPVWSDTISRDPSAQALAEKQIQFYAAELKRADPYRKQNVENGEAVGRAQAYLQGLTGPDKILQALLNQVRQQPAEHLSNYASNYGSVLTGPEAVEGPYTTGGWNAVEESIRDHKLVSSGEPCVVGNNGGVAGWAGDASMDAQVQKEYSDSYTQSWKEFLEGHHVIPFTNATDAAQKLRTLADNNRSPLLALVYMTSTNTNVAVAQTLSDRASSTLRTAAVDTTNKVKEAINKIGGSKTPLVQTPAALAQPEPLATVRSAFDPVHAMVDPGSRDSWLNEKNQAYVKALSGLSDAFQTLPPQVHTDVSLETQELQQAKTAVSTAEDALHALAGNFHNTPTGIDVDLQNLLREPIDLARRTISSIPVIKASESAGGGGVVVPPPPDPSVQLKIKASIRQVNNSMVGVCSTAAALQHKFPFDATSTTDATVEELNQLLQPGTGSYSQFANLPDVSKTYNHSGRVWAGKPDFPATYSQSFVATLNSFGEVEDELYGDGAPNPHVDLTLTVDGTGKIPFEIDVDGHTLKFNPGHPTAPLRLTWPPITASPTRLVLKNGSKNNALPVQWTGVWGLFHMLQSSDDQSGNVYTFRTVQFAHSMNPLTNDKGVQGTVQIRVDSAAANIFPKGYFSKLRCNETWALQPQASGP